MSATKTISIISSREVRVTAYHNKSTIIVDNPEIDEMLKEVAWDDIVEFVRGEKVSPDEVFTDEQLKGWAEENGYVKTMSAYAKQQAIAFMNWTLESGCPYSCTDENQWTSINDPDDSITTEQLHEKFIEQQNKP